MTAAQLLALAGPDLGDLTGWWPGENPFEVAVGAFLVQAVAWRNARQAIEGLRSAGLLEAQALATATHAKVAEAIRPALFHRQKARYLLTFASFVRSSLAGDIARLRSLPLPDQERVLLELPGVGPETAAAIMVYALGEAAPVVDAYALRVLRRIGAISSAERRSEARACMAGAIDGDAAVARLLHATIVELARRHCRVEPLCAGCPCRELCPKILGHPAQGRGDRGDGNAGRAAAGREGGNAGANRAPPAQGGGRAGARFVGQGTPSGLGQSQRARERPGRRDRGA